jgi:hypothetical protein
MASKIVRYAFVYTLGKGTRWHIEYYSVPATNGNYFVGLDSIPKRNHKTVKKLSDFLFNKYPTLLEVIDKT